MNQGVGQSQPLPEVRVLRHDIRGRMNALVLCASALDESLPPHEALEFVNHIEKTAEKLEILLEKLQAMSA